VWIELEQQPQQIRCTVRDDGIGFDVRATFAARGGLGIGLLSIRERLEEMGGTLEITSAPEQGTTLCMTIPLEDDDVVPDPDHS
jgi:two-component system sensor histidine kinase NreB